MLCHKNTQSPISGDFFIKPLSYGCHEMGHMGELKSDQHYTPLQPISGSCDHPLLHFAHPLGPAPKHSNSHDI